MGEEMNLDKMKVAELRSLAKELGLKGYSSLKKAELVKKISDHQADSTQEEPAEKEIITAAEETPSEEPAPEEAPAEEPAAEEPPTEEAAVEEPPVEEPQAEEIAAQEPVAEEVAPAEEPPAKEEKPVPEPVVLSPEMIAIKKEKRSLKAQIAEAISDGDREKTKALRNRKKEIRRLLKRKTGQVY